MDTRRDLHLLDILADFETAMLVTREVNPFIRDL